MELEPRPVVRVKWRVILEGEFGLGTALYIYKNKRALPRFFLTGKARVLASGADVVAALEKASLDELRSIAFLEQQDISELRPFALDGEGGTVTIKQYSADRIVLDVVSKGREILVVTNNYNRFWKACVEGKEAPLFPVDHTFQGVVVNHGRQEVTLEYAPPYGLLRTRSCS